MASDALLVHVCCAPCLCGPLTSLLGRDGRFTAYFHNPNVHPFIEFRRRLKACQVLADQERFRLVADTEYGLLPFLTAIGDRTQAPERCRVCYALRLEATARTAAEEGLPAFTSTLLVSRQQDREVICEVGRAAAERHGVAFETPDWRSGQEAGLRDATRRQLYRQQYCGCIFSEYERYKDTNRHVYRQAAAHSG
ncbi:epoxyqueuosine reductase QueH [bacterium]|nr:epoxyqueuosine reductase QueH [bacterium]